MAQQAFGGPPPSPGPRSPLPPNPPYGGRGGPDQQNRMPPPIRPPQAPYNNFSRPDGARSPTVGGPGHMQNLDTRGLGYGQTPPLTPNSPRVPPQYQDQRPRTPNDQGGRSPMPNVERSPPIHRKPIANRSDSLRQQEHPVWFRVRLWTYDAHGRSGPAQLRSLATRPPARQQLQRQYSERSAASSHYDAASRYESRNTPASASPAKRRLLSSVLALVSSERQAESLRCLICRTPSIRYP
ncbi:PH domain-containing protein [Verticillium alfalfae VaMs.102]|uniref:PH domain-containing protein n=1 Tax=Verticillium alfalfae (strain VaMs.102 / ATCC MYA-4576 / FGSC 10136) TaxID=526221 RepID=C9SMH8_VERA1|nr:PH domain-containing protein [Verticillium alfalfae VaMs.102]EEY19993.1 PH domain-containing protein [Verticillium alfalfae VaMs.102]